MKYMRIAQLALFQMWMVVPLCAQGPPAGTDPVIEKEQQPKEITNNEPGKLPLELAGYLSVRSVSVDLLEQHRFFREYSGSLFVSKTIGRWRFHSELNANSAPQEDAEGIHLFTPRRSLSVKVDSASLNYNWRDWLQADAGFLFVPTYSRTHRYQSTNLTVDEPLMDQNVFPPAFAGIAIRGDKFFDEGGLSYQIYGGATQEGHFSLMPGDTQIDRAPALGGKLVLHVPTRHFFNTFDIGFHRLEEWNAADFERHHSNGWEVHVDKGRVGFLAEFARTSMMPSDGKPTHFREGYYVQPSYRITPRLFAVASYDFLDADSLQPTKNSLARQSAGLTYRPLPGLSLKLEADRYQEQRGRLPAYYGATAGIVYFFRLP
jgi:hypothetical protein